MKRERKRERRGRKVSGDVCNRNLDETVLCLLSNKVILVCIMAIIVHVLIITWRRDVH